MNNTEIIIRASIIFLLAFILGFFVSRNGIKNGYHWVRRIRNDKEADRQLADRLKKIESESFEFEKVI